MITPAPRPRLGYVLKVAGALLGILALGALLWEIVELGGVGPVSALRTLGLGLLAIWLYGKGRGAESPATHGTAAIARRDLEEIAHRHRDLAVIMTEPSTSYAGSSDEDLVEVYGAIDKDAERFKELIAEIRRRVGE